MLDSIPSFIFAPAASELAERRAALTMAGTLTPDDRKRLLAEKRDRLNHVSASLRGQYRQAAGMAYSLAGRVAVLPIFGVLTQRPDWLTQLGWGVAVDQFAEAHAQLVNDSGIDSVVWLFDSPGGSVAGVPEAFARLFALRGRKRTVAVCDPFAASAAYWLASAADEIVASPSSFTGAIGVLARHLNESRKLDKAGQVTTYIAAGKHKVDALAPPELPLSEAARAEMQRTVDALYGMFIRDVAKGRGTTPGAVRSGYGQGFVLTAPRAVAAGLADRVGTLPDVIGRLSGSDKGGVGRSTASGSSSLRLLWARQRHAEAF